MKIDHIIRTLTGICIINTVGHFNTTAQTVIKTGSNNSFPIFLVVLSLLILILLLAALYLYGKTQEIKEIAQKRGSADENRFKEYINRLDSRQIEHYLKLRRSKTSNLRILTLTLVSVLWGSSAVQAQTQTTKGSLLGEGGIIITLVLILIPVIAGIILMIVKVRRILKL